MATPIEAMLAEDWPEVLRIYAEGVATGNATLETALPSQESWDAAHLATCRLVLREEAHLLGWAALSPFSRRHAYRGVGEVSIYITAAARGRGLGTLLLQRLIEVSEREQFWTLQGAILRENLGSIALHQRCGFRLVGVRERLGEQDGRWRDVLLFERRSLVNG